MAHPEQGVQARDRMLDYQHQRSWQWWLGWHLENAVLAHLRSPSQSKSENLLRVYP